jgi:type II secretory pathway pseudopilin PulG
MSNLFWGILRIGGYLAIGLVSLIVALVVAMLGLFGVAALSYWRNERRLKREEHSDNAELHERIQAYLRQQLTAQE